MQVRAHRLRRQGGFPVPLLDVAHSLFREQPWHALAAARHGSAQKGANIRQPRAELRFIPGRGKAGGDALRQFRFGGKAVLQHDAVEGSFADCF